MKREKSTMSSRNAGLLAAALLLFAGATAAHEFGKFGRPATPEEIASWDIGIAPDGTGLPAGSGTAKQGETVYATKCLGCHGEKGKGATALALAGGNGTIGKANQLKTIGSFWPYATTIFDYVYTAMPYPETKSLTHEETYAVTAYLLNINGIIGENELM